jgi:ethanolamine utilization protein EutN
MNLARVRGTVVATRRSDKVEGANWLLVEECDQQGAGRGEYLVALDMVGADRGQVVLLTQGSSCRWTSRTDDRPMDTLVVAIVDEIDQAGATVFGAGTDAEGRRVQGRTASAPVGTDAEGRRVQGRTTGARGEG